MRANIHPPAAAAVQRGEIARGFAKRIVLGVGSSVLTQVINASQQIVLVPLFLRAWGAEGYGDWIALTAIISYLSLLDLGGQSYFANLLAIAHSRNDLAGFRRILSEGLSLFLAIGTSAYLVLMALMLLGTHVPLPVVGRPLLAREVWILGCLSAFVLLMAIPGGVYATSYRATGRYAQGAMLANSIRFVLILLFALVLGLRVSPEGFAATTLVLGILQTAIPIWHMRRNLSGCRGIRVTLVEAAQGSRHLGGATGFWVLAIACTLNQQGAVLVLLALTSPAVIAMYVTHRLLSSLSGYVVMLVQSPLLPEFTFLWARRQENEFRRLYRNAIRVTTLATGCMAVLVWTLAPRVYPVWTMQQLEIDSLLLFLMLSQAILAAGWGTSALPLLAVNQHRVLAGCALGSAVLALSLGGVLAAWYGVIGVIAAGLIADTLCGLMVYPILSARFMGLNPWSVYREILSSGAVSFACLAGSFASSHYLPSPWSEAISLGLTGMLAAAVVWTVRHSLRSRIQEEAFDD